MGKRWPQEWQVVLSLPEGTLAAAIFDLFPHEGHTITIIMGVSSIDGDAKASKSVTIVTELERIQSIPWLVAATGVKTESQACNNRGTSIVSYLPRNGKVARPLKKKMESRSTVGWGLFVMPRNRFGLFGTIPPNPNPVPGRSLISPADLLFTMRLPWRFRVLRFCVFCGDGS